MKTLSRFVLLLTILFGLCSQAFAQYGQVRFASSTLIAYESDGVVNVGVTTSGGSLQSASSIFVETSSTATLYVDYTTNSILKVPGAQGLGIGSVSGVQGTTQYVPITLINNTNIQSYRVINMGFWGTASQQISPSNCTIYILDDDSIVTLNALDPKAYENGKTPGTFQVSRYGDTSFGLTVNFTKSGSAAYPTDYTLAGPSITATSVTIPAGENSAIIEIRPVDDATIETNETVTLTLAGGYYKTNTLSSGTVTIFDNDAVVSIAATDSTASESGDSGLFTVTRTADTASPLTVKYLISGSASNGVDYAFISNSVVIPSGEVSATITIAPLYDLVVEGNEAVTLTLITNGYTLGSVTNATVTISDFDDNTREVPVIGGLAPNARYGRFSRGTGSYPTYHSFVVPIDFQQGVPLDDSGGNATNLFPGISWNDALFHFNLTNTAAPIPFSNPIAAFGNRVGGSPLYFGQPYRFGIYAGDPKPFSTNGNTYTNALRIKVYDQSTFSLVATTNFLIPNISDTNEWAAFLTNGYSKTISTHGLTTTLSFNNMGATWNSWSATTNQFDVAYHLTHTATSSNYMYLVELAGGTSEGWMVTSNDNRAWSPLYTIEFEKRPAWRSLLLQSPQFFTEPMPPGYMGRSAEELLTNNPPVTNLVSVPNPISSYTNLDQSPELRTNAVLDQFVLDMNKDPLLLANYVLNEIELTDAIDYNDNGVMSQTEINLGGVNRGALGTFLEGQGSPTEQCGLLVYLLRKAGYPTVYLFPPRNGLKMVDARLSKMLRVQIRKAVDENGNIVTTNQFIPVNYPWVATYVGTNWVHIFPWLKDTQVEEGANLYDYMPPEYDNAFKWAKAYSYGDTNLLSLNPEDDSPLIIYPKFIEKILREKSPGMTIDKIGMKAWNRRNYHSRWEDFPTPTSLINSNIVVESLGSSSITNVSPALTNIFNTVSVEISAVNAPTKKVSSGELRMAELHNRRLVAWHTKVSTNQHTLNLSLASFRTNITAKKAFTTAQLTNAANTNVLCELTNRVTLAATNDLLKMTLVHNRNRALTGGYSAPYLGFSEITLSVTNIGYLRKGDLAAICLDAGRVTRKMLDQHAEEVWAMEKTGSAGATEEYQGSIAYLMGMSYYEKADRFTSLAARLHKAQPIANFASGLSMLRAKRDSSDALPNGDIILVQPVVDMFFKEVAAIGNRTVHLDSGDSGYGPNAQVFELSIAAGSALEHNIINRFFKQSDAVSTVKLLQMAQNGTTNGVVFLNRFNYTNEGNKVYPAGSTNKLKDFDPSIWNVMTNLFTTAYISNNVQAYVTPGKLSNATRSFTGMGALIFSPGKYYALIGEANGGYGPNLNDATLDLGSLPTTSLQVNQDNEVSLNSNPYGENSVLTAGAPSLVDQVGYGNSIINGTTKFNDTKLSELDSGNVLLGSGANRQVQQEELNELGGMDPNFKGKDWEWVKDPVNALTGEFYIDAVDLRLHGPMPLEVRRNYGSHNVFNNEFGYGWKINYMPFLTVGKNSHLVYAAEADGSVLAYRRQTNNGVAQNLWLPTVKDNPRLQNVAGSVRNLYNTSITRTGTTLNSTYTLKSPDGSTRTFIIRAFSLGGGLNRQRPYLDTWQDAQGNYFKFFYGTNAAAVSEFGKVRRVESSNGNFLGFKYDIYGRVIEAFTGDGRRLYYEYDDFGDLVRVQLPDASEIKYDYQHEVLTTNSTRQIYSTHLISRERKPDGRLLQNDYDDERRVINQYATVGADFRLIRNASFAYSNNFALKTAHTNALSGYTLITDHLTNVSRYEYTSNVLTRTVDPLLRTNVQEWYGDNETNAPAYPRGLKRTVDARGLTNDYKYDVQGNVTNLTVTGELTGHGGTQSATTSFTFNTNRLMMSLIDPAGNKTVFNYTNSLFPFLRTSEERYSSNDTLISITTFDYYSVTNVGTNGTSVFTNRAFGLKQREVRAAGSSDAATNEWAHDARGFVTQETRFTGTSDPAVTNFFYHNLRGELVMKWDAVSRGTEFSYNARGDVQWKEVFDEQGSTVSREAFYYNQNGQLEWTDGPRFGPEDYTWRDYDGAGNVIEETRWRSRAKEDGTGVEAESGDALFATTFSEYDPLGNLLKVIDPRGNYQRMFYDPVGQLLEKRSYDGTYGTNATPLAVESFSYEPGGSVTRATNALRGVTQKFYTSTGKLKSQINPDGSEYTWRYYLDGRPQREITDVWKEFTYDDANRTKTTVVYGRGGAVLGTNLTEMDRRGNVIRTVDVAGNSFTNFFDGLDRLKWTRGPRITFDPPEGTPLPPGGGPPPPVQQAVTNYYDSANVVLTNVNALGEKTITYFDALGRTTRKEIRSANDTLVRETSIVYSTDHHSVTVTEGSGTNAIVTTTFTDNEGNPVLNISYPNGTAREFSRQEYDQARNLTFSGHYSKTNSAVTLWTQATHTYDGMNRRSSTADRDGALTLFYRDAAGNTTNRVMPGGLQWRAEYNSAGQILKSFNLATGGVGTRTNLFTYYPSNNYLFAGLLYTSTDGRGVVCTHTYDAFQRPATNSYDGPLSEHDSLTVFGYNSRGLVTNISESFINGTNGPGTAVRRSYDAYGLLSGETTYLNGNMYFGASQSRDSAGRRSALGLGTFGYNFGWRADGSLASVGNNTYGYTTAGLLNTRNLSGSGANVSVNVTLRDGTGRVLSRNTAVNSVTRLSEAMAWTGDGLMSAHTVAREDFTDYRSYEYADDSRRLVSEKLNITNGVTWTNVFGYDGGASGGSGVLTRMAEPHAGGAEWTANVDLFNRVERETNNVVRRMASGKVNATEQYAAVSVNLDGRPLPINLFSTGATNWPREWRTVMELRPGTHTLQAVAKHSSGMFTTNKTATFTNNAVDQTTLSHFAEGQLAYRVWKNSIGETNRVQTFKWDGRSRLLKTTEVDASNNGYILSAVYDGLGRRLQTTTIVITNGIALTNQPKVVNQFFDPEVEFLEVGVEMSGKRIWSIYGPDLDGTYGGLNGTGGFEGTVDDLGVFRPVVSDARGNVHGEYDPYEGSMLWNASRPTGYGAIPEYRPTPFSQNGSMAVSRAWRGRAPDISGLIWLGARYYDPVAGRFISCDPYGHESDPSLYAFAGGNPIGYFDPDGRLGIMGGKTFDFAWNLAVSVLFTPNVQSMSAEQRTALANIAVEQYGSPMQRIFGYEQSSAVTELPAQLSGPAQDVMLAYGATRGGNYAPAPQRQMAWGAPIEPYVMRDSAPVYQLNTIPQQQQQPIVTVLGSAKDVAQYANKPGFNVLQMPANIPRAQWDNYNRYWMMNAYTRGDSFWLATDPVAFSRTLNEVHGRDTVSAYFRVEMPILESFNVRQNAVPAYLIPGGPPAIAPQTR